MVPQRFRDQRFEVRPDPDELDGTPVGTAYSSYRAIAGTFMYPPLNSQILAAETGMFPDVGGPTWFNKSPSQSPVPLSTVTDGLSNTIMLGDSAHAKLSRNLSSPLQRSRRVHLEQPRLVGRLGLRRRFDVYVRPMNLKGGRCHASYPARVMPASIVAIRVEHAFRWMQLRMGDGSVSLISDTVSTWNSLAMLRDANCIPQTSRNANGNLPSPLHS